MLKLMTLLAQVVKNPLFDYLVGTGSQGGPVIAQFLAKDQKKIEDYLSMPEIRKLLPSEKKIYSFFYLENLTHLIM